MKVRTQTYDQPRTLRDLIETLEDIAEEYGDDIGIRLAIQPSWPFEHAIGPIGVTGPTNDDPHGVVYIAEARQVGYLSGAAGVAVGWSEADDDDDDNDDDGITETRDRERRADRIAALSVVHPDMTVEQLEALDADAQQHADLAEDYPGQRIRSAADGVQDDADPPARPDYDTRDREGR